MTHPAKSVLTFGMYLIVEGFLLLFVPNWFLNFVGLPPSDEIWVRVVGWAVIALGYYYIHSARINFTPFFKWTVHIRYLQFVVFIIFVVLNLASVLILFFSGIEFLSGVWTHLALKQAGAKSGQK